MIREFVDRFIASEATTKATLAQAQPESYDALVKQVIQIITRDADDYPPDPERIHVIDDGDYQGTRLFIVGATGYQPNTYWSIFVSYGSCSGCDSLEAAKGYSDDPPTAEQVSDYWTMMLHMVESMQVLRQEADE